MVRKLRVRFELRTLTAATGGFLLGAGIVLVRVGDELETIPGPLAWFAPSGRGVIIEGVVAAAAGLTLLLLSGLRR